MKILDYIETRETGKRIAPLRPIPATLTREVSADSFGPVGINPIHLEIEHRILLGARTRIPEDASDREELVNHNERKVRRMFAESLYGEARIDLLEILRYVYENYCDRELAEMIDKLMRKMQ